MRDQEVPCEIKVLRAAPGSRPGPGLVVVASVCVVVFSLTQGVVTCSREIDTEREAVREALRSAGYVPLEVLRGFRDEAGVRTLDARAMREGEIFDVVVVRDGAGPWKVAVRSAR